MKIKIKSLVVSALLVIMAAGFFLMHSLFVPEKTQGLYYVRLVWCPTECSLYAIHQCPDEEVQQLCFSDCMDICLNPPEPEQ